MPISSSPRPQQSPIPTWSPTLFPCPGFTQPGQGLSCPGHLLPLGPLFATTAAVAGTCKRERPSPRAEEGVSREGGPGEPAPAARGCPSRAAGMAARCPRPRRGAAAVPAAGGACGQRSGAARGGAGRGEGRSGEMARQSPPGHCCCFTGGSSGPKMRGSRLERGRQQAHQRTCSSLTQISFPPETASVPGLLCSIRAELLLSP